MNTNLLHRVSSRPGSFRALIRLLLAPLAALLVFAGTTLAASESWESCLSHLTDADNTGGHITTIDHSALNGKPDLKLFITNNWNGTHVDHPLAVYYAGGTWRIFTEDRSAMPLGVNFNVIACAPGPNVIAHTSAAGNIALNQTILNHPLLNGNPGAKLVVTRDWTIGATYITKHFGVWYDGSRWTIYTEDQSDMPEDINFNVLIDPDGSRLITHVSSVANISIDFAYTEIDHPELNGNPDAKLVVTHDYGAFGPYLDVPVSVWYAAGKWVILREDVVPPAAGLNYNILLGQSSPTLHVTPGQSIQDAIDAAAPGNTVEVAAGTYDEDLTLRSGVSVVGEGPDTTILRGTGNDDVVVAANVTDAEFSGLCITGNGAFRPASGIRISGSSLVVSNNKISGTTTGIETVNSNAVICGNRITGTGDPANGRVDYGIRSNGNDLITNNLIVANLEAGIFCNGAGFSAQVINNTIADNPGTGFHAAWGSPTLKNNILSGSSALGIFAENEAAVASSYNCISGFTSNYSEVRDGVISGRLGDLLVSPVFDPLTPGDYFLALSSPCIDAGDPGALYNDLDGSRNDMGAYGGPCSPLGAPSIGADNGFLFTSVGNIPTSEIDAGGLANNSSYVNAPFGGSSLQIFGDFGRGETNVTHYTLHIGSWSSGAPPVFPVDFTPVTDALSKTFWASAGTPTPTSVAVGPHLVGGLPFYARTDNNFTGGFWAFENVMVRLNTKSLPDGKYDLVLRAYQSSGPTAPGGPPTAPAPVALSPNAALTLEINNKRPTAQIVRITKDDLLEIDECAVIKLTPDHTVDHDSDPGTPDQPRSTQNLRFVVTVNHPDGYLQGYSLKANVGRNRPSELIGSESYAPAGGISWTGVNNALFHSADAMGAGIPPVGGTLKAWESCAYQFTLRATARTTNGYIRIYRADPYNDNLAIDLGALCGPNPDLDGDGDVDGDDLELFSQAFGQAGGN